MTSKIVVFNVLVAVVYTAMLAWLYAFHVSEVWGYMGFRRVEEVTLLPLMFCFAAVITYFTPCRYDARGILLSAVNYFFVLPSIVFAFLAEADFRYLAILVTSVVLVIVISSAKLQPIRFFSFRSSQFLYLVFGVSILLVVLYAVLGGGWSVNFQLAAIYDIRARNVESLPGFLGYLVSVVSMVLIPMTIIYSMNRRNYIILSLAVLLQVVFFGLTNFKIILFSPILIVLLYLFLQNDYKRLPLGLFFALLPAFAFVEIFLYRFLLSDEHTSFIVNHFIRRFLFAPPMLDERHIVFFSSNPWYFWATSKLGLGIAENPYGLASPFVIGLEFFGSESWAANTGFIGSGYSHAGAFGTLLYAGLFGLLVAFLNAYGRLLGHGLVAALSLLTVLTIARSSDFTTVILTHGLFFLLVALAVIPREQKKFNE